MARVTRRTLQRCKATEPAQEPKYAHNRHEGPVRNPPLMLTARGKTTFRRSGCLRRSYWIRRPSAARHQWVRMRPRIPNALQAIVRAVRLPNFLGTYATLV